MEKALAAGLKRKLTKAAEEVTGKNNNQKQKPSNVRKAPGTAGGAPSAVNYVHSPSASKYGLAFFFVLLWFVYIAFSAASSYGAIPTSVTHFVSNAMEYYFP